MAQASRDNNFVPTLLGVSSVDLTSPTTVAVDPTTHRVLVTLTGGSVISTSMQKDLFSSTNNQTTFIPSKTLVYDFYMSVNGAIQTPATDYSIVGGSYVLNTGIPAGCSVILLYSIT